MSESAALEHRLTALERDQSSHGKRLDGIDKKVGEIDKELKDIVKLLSSRPTWFITGLLTILTTVTSGLIVYVVTTHH